LRMKITLFHLTVCASVNHLKLQASGNQLPTNPRPGTDRIFFFFIHFKTNILYLRNCVFQATPRNVFRLAALCQSRKRHRLSHVGLIIHSIPIIGSSLSNLSQTLTTLVFLNAKNSKTIPSDITIFSYQFDRFSVEFFWAFTFYRTIRCLLFAQMG